jgi:hypothetical protein
VSIKLKLESATDVLNLNGIAENGTGFQALVGASGLGLPPVSVQWIEGAGDGASFRGRRVLTRSMDIPLDILGRDRDHLKQLTSRLAMALAAPAELVVISEGGSEWSTRVVRTGGGGFQYGIDTRGTRDLQLILTLEAGDPYFTSREVSQRIISTAVGGSWLSDFVAIPLSSGETIGSINIENTGDADAYPVWTITGPGTDFQTVSPRGETLRWEGTLSAGQTLTLDTRTGTVKDGAGVNRYADLAPAPRFWSVPPGVTTSQVSMSGTDANSKIVCAWRARKWMVV